MAIGTSQLEAWLREFAKSIAEAQGALGELDAAAGDADHGANMNRGMVAVRAMLEREGDQPTPGDLLKETGLTLMRAIGGSSGALYGTFFLRMAKVAGDRSTLDANVLSSALDAALQGIVDRGQAQAGDKTMYDALAPAVAAFKAAVSAGGSIRQALAAATLAAESGRDATANMQARRGKSSYLGERSVGHQDPGAASVALLIAAAARTLPA
jgi:dihydroxyacetone kinase-like protein